jgi:PTH1 family peptidyl-tRNA hydrolase
LVVGLGNPGERYARTRHNVAWAVLDELAARHAAGEAPGHATFRARRAVIAEHELELLQPLAYMNLSGEALLAWRERNGNEHELLVVSDDVYLPLGMLRLRASGSSGGHRGLDSIEAAVGSRDYLRLRIGVGAPNRGPDPAEDTAALREHVLATDRRAADAVECWLAEGALGAMNQFNRKADPAPVGDREEESET